MDTDEMKTPVSTQPFLVLASTLTAAGFVIILIDLYAPQDTIPRTVVSLSMVMMASCWNVYFVWTALRRVDKQLSSTQNRDEYCRGYVDGVSRRGPESDAVRLVHSAS